MARGGLRPWGFLHKHTPGLAAPPAKNLKPPIRAYPPREPAAFWSSHLRLLAVRSPEQQILAAQEIPGERQADGAAFGDFNRQAGPVVPDGNHDPGDAEPDQRQDGER